MEIKKVKKKGKVIGYKNGTKGKLYKISVYGIEQAKLNAEKQYQKDVKNGNC